MENKQVIGGISKRIAEIDMAKGFVAILVAVGHLVMIASDKALAYRIIFAFHMPAFFLLAGLC